MLRSACPGTNTKETNSQSMQRVTQEVANPEGSVGCSGCTVVGVCCEDKLRSLSEGETKTLVEVSGDSIAKILGGPVVSESC